jgi:hypothetical protein
MAMRATQFHEILQDAELADAIGPIIRKHRLSVAATTDLLESAGLVRAENVTQIVFNGLAAVVTSKL